MIFGVPKHIEMIRNGLYFLPSDNLNRPIEERIVKTQTRRVNRGIYQIGKDYAVQSKRGVKAEANIRIVIDAIWEEWCDYGGGHPYRILPKNAKAEGGYTREEFEKLFREINPNWDGKKRWAFRFHGIEVKK